MLPALSLQPLVENAVKHGIGKRPGGGTITISSVETETEYLVSVEDDGTTATIHIPKNNKKNNVFVTSL